MAHVKILPHVSVSNKFQNPKQNKKPQKRKNMNNECFYDVITLEKAVFHPLVFGHTLTNIA